MEFTVSEQLYYALLALALLIAALTWGRQVLPSKICLRKPNIVRWCTHVRQSTNSEDSSQRKYGSGNDANCEKKTYKTMPNQRRRGHRSRSSPRKLARSRASSRPLSSSSGVSTEDSCLKNNMAHHEPPQTKLTQFRSCDAGGVDSDSDDDISEEIVNPPENPSGTVPVQKCHHCAAVLEGKPDILQCQNCGLAFYCTYTCSRQGRFEHSRAECARFRNFAYLQGILRETLIPREIFCGRTFSMSLSDVPTLWSTALGGSKITLLLEIHNKDKCTPNLLHVQDKLGTEATVRFQKKLKMCNIGLALDTDTKQQAFNACLSSCDFCVLFGAHWSSNGNEEWLGTPIDILFVPPGPMNYPLGLLYIMQTMSGRALL